jgi:hypothetical protein
MRGRLLHIFLTLILLILIFFRVKADDPGITKARLIQTNDSTYILEADVSQALLWAIKTPIFPDRFKVSELEYVSQSGWIIARSTAISNGAGLIRTDEIMLPWARNGADLTIQWMDGTIQKRLFMRSLDGIRVPLRAIIPYSPSNREIFVEHFQIGLNHFASHWAHLLLVFIVFGLKPGLKSLNLMLFLTSGQAVGMILHELGVPSFDLMYIELLGLMVVFVSAIAFFTRPANGQIRFLLLTYGLLHSLGYGSELSSLNLASHLRIPAILSFNLALDLVSYILLLSFIPFFYILKNSLKLKNPRKVLIYISGILSVTIFLILFNSYQRSGQAGLIPFEESKYASMYAMPVSDNPMQQGAATSLGARKLTSPIMIFLTIEPYEIRQEILIQARAAVQLLGINERGMKSIPIISLKPIKDLILRLVRESTPVTIDKEPANPALELVDFVTLSSAGVFPRLDPVIEDLDAGIIGLTYVYEIPGLADEVSFDWELFNNDHQQFEVTTIDPFGGATRILSKNDNTVQWKNRITGFALNELVDIRVNRKKLPVVSLIVFLSGILLFIVFFKIRNGFQLRFSGVFLIITAFILYPFLRYPVKLPGSLQLKPSEEQVSTLMDDLLTNVYQAFDVRDEERVYDRLSVSSTGDQLTKIYLENRKSLEFENRSGARANVDRVDIIGINTVSREEGQTYVVDTEWLVSGSVNHFGHTHYRRNQYHAYIHLSIVDDFWKIRDIELIEEKRIL